MISTLKLSDFALFFGDHDMGQQLVQATYNGTNYKDASTPITSFMRELLRAENYNFFKSTKCMRTKRHQESNDVPQNIIDFVITVALFHRLIDKPSEAGKNLVEVIKNVSDEVQNILKLPKNNSKVSNIINYITNELSTHSINKYIDDKTISLKDVNDYVLLMLVYLAVNAVSTSMMQHDMRYSGVHDVKVNELATKIMSAININLPQNIPNKVTSATMDALVLSFKNIIAITSKELEKNPKFMKEYKTKAMIGGALADEQRAKKIAWRLLTEYNKNQKDIEQNNNAITMRYRNNNSRLKKLQKVSTMKKQNNVLTETENDSLATARLLLDAYRHSQKQIRKDLGIEEDGEEDDEEEEVDEEEDEEEDEEDSEEDDEEEEVGEEEDEEEDEDGEDEDGAGADNGAGANTVTASAPLSAPALLSAPAPSSTPTPAFAPPTSTSALKHWADYSDDEDDDEKIKQIWIEYLKKHITSIDPILPDHLKHHKTVAAALSALTGENVKANADVKAGADAQAGAPAHASKDRKQTGGMIDINIITNAVIRFLSQFQNKLHKDIYTILHDNIATNIKQQTRDIPKTWIHTTLADPNKKAWKFFKKVYGKWNTMSTNSQSFFGQNISVFARRNSSIVDQQYDSIRKTSNDTNWVLLTPDEIIPLYETLKNYSKIRDNVRVNLMKNQTNDQILFGSNLPNIEQGVNAWYTHKDNTISIITHPPADFLRELYRSVYSSGIVGGAINVKYNSPDISFILFNIEEDIDKRPNVNNLDYGKISSAVCKRIEHCKYPQSNTYIGSRGLR